MSGQGQAPVVGLFGRRGVGKSTLARQIARHQGRLLVWDYIGEYGPLAYRSEGNLQALVSYLREGHRQPFFAARYIPRTGEVEEFEAFCGIAYRCRNTLIVVEEAAAICQASYLPPAFGRIVRQGRHRGLGMLWCTQRLNEVSRTLTSLTDVWAGFALSEPADLMALAQRCGREYAERIAKLPRFEWLGYNVDDQSTFTDKTRLFGLWGAPHVWADQGRAVIRA